jgi:chromosome segregation ATPase
MKTQFRKKNRSTYTKKRGGSKKASPSIALKYAHQAEETARCEHKLARLDSKITDLSNRLRDAQEQKRALISNYIKIETKLDEALGIMAKAPVAEVFTRSPIYVDGEPTEENW